LRYVLTKFIQKGIQILLLGFSIRGETILSHGKAGRWTNAAIAMIHFQIQTMMFNLMKITLPG
jgi:hypothetical protein